MTPSTGPSWDEYVEKLRSHWTNVPSGAVVADSRWLSSLSDDALMTYWDEKLRNDDYESRGWYRDLYAPIVKGKTVLDVGAGMGMDSVTFSQAGATVTSLDIIETNVKLVARIAALKGTPLNSVYLDRLSRLDGLPTFDFIWCAGSFHHAPSSALKEEALALTRHLPPGGRWLQLAYPKARWEREGRLAFNEWGRKTDSEAPWVEWYDLPKLRELLAPAEFRAVMTFNFHNDDFNWFDLKRL